MTLPDKLTAAEFERLKAQEQRMLNSGSWAPQAEDRLTAQVNRVAADAAAPDSMTAGQADAAESQQSVMQETSFGRSVGMRPDYSQPPAQDPADNEPKTIGELRKRQQDLYNDPTYDMPFDEWQDFTRWKEQNESEVGSFIGGIPGMAQSLGQLGVGLVKERAQQAYRATSGLDPVGAAATEIATFKEMGRKIGVGLTQLSDWVGGKLNDVVESGRRVGQVQQNVIQALRDNGQLTGDPIKDNTTIQKALEEAAAQGMYEPTEQQTAEDDETGYQRYLRKKAYDREYSSITEFSIGGNRMTLPDVRETVTMPTLLPNTEQSKGVNVERQVFQPQEATSTAGAMALSPENALPVGVGVLARARMLRRLASVTGTPLRATETAMASIDDWMTRTADRVTSKIPIVGDLPLRQRAYALGAAGGVGAYLDATTDSPLIDVVAKPLIFAGAVLPTVKLFGGTLRRVGAGAGAGWQVIKEMDAGAVGSARAETAARMAASGKFNPRYSKYMERGAQGGVESTLRRVSQNPDMPETLRRVARSADNIGITQLARGIDDAVSSSVTAGIAATPFALVAPDSETAGGIVGGAVLLGGTLGTAGRVIGRRSARTDADIARMMVDVEMAGGDAGSLGALSYSGLDLLSAMQGITSGKVDFVPLRAQEYRANADVRASGGETVAGLHIEQAADGRAKVYVNMGHTAPIAGRVSIKPVQITRNGKTEDANVVRIKGEDGQSDFTVVPKEYPLLVKSGDIVEPNARLARGLSPTHVMPHEIGHAILTSGILNGAIRDDLRNLVNQRYDTAGVEARGREYVTRIVDKDILAGAHDQLPDRLTQQEFDDIANGRRTMADVLKGKPVSDAQREAMINDRYNEMRERSIAEGNNPDGLDVFRDEIVAETFSSLSDGIDFRRMRTGGPQVMESVLAATTRVFETLGMAFDRSTGRPLDNPSVVFRDNPLMKDPVMRKRMQEHLRNYEAWMLGMEQAGAREQKGTQISVDGSAESARRSTHTKLRANENGVLENDLIYIDQNGQAQWKSQGMLDQQERGRTAQVGQLYDKNKVLPPNSAEFGLRRAGAGRTIISGPTLPAKFDVLRWFPKHLREMARMLEASRERGASHIFDYNTIGSGETGRYRVINRGDVRAIMREAAFLGWEATKNGHLKAVVMDLNAFRSAAMRAINRGELGVFNNDMTQLQADLMVYLSNHKNGLPGEATIGQQKRDMLNGLIGTGTAVQRDINPLYADLNPRGSVRSFRFDRINDITTTGREGYHFDYDKIKNNRMPQARPDSGQAMPDTPRNPADMPSEQQPRGQAMPDSADYTADRLRSLSEDYNGRDVNMTDQDVVEQMRFIIEDAPAGYFPKSLSDNIDRALRDIDEQYREWGGRDDLRSVERAVEQTMRFAEKQSRKATPRGQAMPDVGPVEKSPRPPKYAKNAPIKVDGGQFINQQVIKSSTSAAKNILDTNPQAFFDRLGQAAQKIVDDPARMASPNGYLEYMRDAGVWGDVLYSPPTLRSIIESPQQYVDDLLGGYHGERTKPGTMEAADAGLDATVRMREAIGAKPPKLVAALHHFWGILSRMLPPVEQESGWLRLISRPRIIEQIQRSIDGNYTLQSADWKKLVQSELRESNAFAKGRGNQATANANAFHGMLSKWNGQWDRVSDVYATDSAIDAGRRFWALGLGSVGIRNKVQRFIGLTYGIPGLIMDRWKFVEFYYPQFGKRPQEYFKYSATGTPEDPMGIYGQYGTIEAGNPNFSLAFYEGMEIALQRAIDNSPALQQVLGRHANVGGMHWKGWNAIKNEAVGHSSLDLTYDLVRANPDPTPETLLQLLQNKQYYTEGLVGNRIERFALPLMK